MDDTESDKPQIIVESAQNTETPTRIGVKVVSKIITAPERQWSLDYVEGNINSAINKPKPDTPSELGLKLSRIGGLSDDEAVESAIRTAVYGWQRELADATLSSEYLEAIRSGSDPLESRPMREAVGVWEQQYMDMLTLLEIPPETPSRVDDGLTLMESYKRRLTPIPEELGYVVFQEEQTGTIFLYENYRSEPVIGVYFPVDAQLVDGLVGADHSKDHTKVHEDSHFLTMCVKGWKGYIGGGQLGMVGEGFAPIFELWFHGSMKSGSLSFTKNTLDVISKGDSPVQPELTEEGPTTQEFWKYASLLGLIHEGSDTVKISAQIMSLLKANDDITFPQLFDVFLKSESIEDFFTEIKQLSPSTESFEKFKSSVGELSTMDRRHERHKL